MATHKRKAPLPYNLGQFGRFIRELRVERRQTQEELAERCELASDTIRRLEYGDFAPSLETLTKLAKGLRLGLAPMFEAYERGDLAPDRQLVALVEDLSAEELALALKVARVLTGLLGTAAARRVGRKPRRGRRA